MNFKNPYSDKTTEYQFWEILIKNDFEAFCTKNWKMIEDDFIDEGFFGIDGKKSANKADWCLTYNSLKSYKSHWMNQSEEFNLKVFECNPLEVFYNTTKLSRIEIKGDIALVHKEFNGRFDIKNEESIIFDWISLFILRKIEGNWKIANFIGYLHK